MCEKSYLLLKIIALVNRLFAFWIISNQAESLSNVFRTDRQINPFALVWKKLKFKQEFLQTVKLIYVSVLEGRINRPLTTNIGLQNPSPIHF